MMKDNDVLYILQAYLRFAHLPVTAEVCSSSSTSPSGGGTLDVLPAHNALSYRILGLADILLCDGSYKGQLPALEHGLDLVETQGDEYAAARAIIASLNSHGPSLDSHLSATQVLCAWSLSYAMLR